MQSRNGAFQAFDYYARKITIDAGDTVTWHVMNVSDPHTITFLAPGQKPPPCGTAQCQRAGGTTFDGTTFTSSGALFAPAQYTLTFTRPGRYIYYCVVHQPEMFGQVIVQPAGSVYPHTPSFYAEIGKREAREDLRDAAASAEQFPFERYGLTLAAGIAPGLAAGRPSESTVLRFLNNDDGRDESPPVDSRIKVGTTVAWVNESNNEIHTVTFPAIGQALPPNRFSPPTAGSSYDGTKLANSGVIFPGGHYRLTFTKPGRYTYYCLFHDDAHTMGTVTVTK